MTSTSVNAIGVDRVKNLAVLNIMASADYS